MEEFSGGFMCGVFVAAAVCIGCDYAGDYEEAHRLRRQAIEFGYAQHNQKTGVWQWKTELEEEAKQEKSKQEEAK